MVLKDNNKKVLSSRKKGFTLIELLAVIVILAIVALIAVPIVLKLIEKSKIGSAKASANNYLEALETYAVTSAIDKSNIKLEKNNKYNVTKNTVINGINYKKINDLVELKGNKPTGEDDYIVLDNNYMVKEASLTLNRYKVIIKDGEITDMIKGEIVKLESITLNKKKEFMEKGSTFNIEVKFNPIDASNQKVTYKSSNEDIVTVNEKGEVTAKELGIAKIIVESKENKNIKAECLIEVIIGVKELKIEPESSEILVGKELTLVGKIEPTNATTSSLIWTSSDINIASVNNSGVVTAVGKGEAIIKATTQNGIEATSKITVKELPKFKDANYGTEISTLYSDVYIKNNEDSEQIIKASNDDEAYSGNYHYPNSLIAKMEQFGKSTSLSSQRPLGGNNTFNLSQTSKDKWILFRIGAGAYTTSVSISNILLDFVDNSSLTLKESVERGYIEPLVIASSSSWSSSYMWQNFYNVVDGGGSGTANYPTGFIIFKVKNKSPLKSIQMNSNKEFSSIYGDKITIYEYHDIDLSISSFK